MSFLVFSLKDIFFHLTVPKVFYSKVLPIL